VSEKSPIKAQSILRACLQANVLDSCLSAGAQLVDTSLKPEIIQTRFFDSPAMYISA
jgi:saccharopine dehydrogenase-like NADP-dependent oxidoreductase